MKERTVLFLLEKMLDPPPPMPLTIILIYKNTTP